MPRYEIVKITEHSHPQDGSRLFLCQIAVNGELCVPFWSHIAQRKELGEEGWLQSLYENAEHLLQEYGKAPALT